MGAKASIHMQPMKAMNASLSDENKRREKSKEWFDRTEDSNGTPYHYDWWRRNLNFEIVKGKICPQLSHTIPLHERLQNRLRELGFKNYKATAKNAPNVCMDFVIGGDRERMREMAFGNQVVNFESSDETNSAVVRQKEIENWALDTYRWAANRYREENIIGFNVHLDETTPHIHMQVIPVAEMKKRGRVKAGKERGTKMTVSFAGVVGEGPKEYSAYKTEMHTDYFLQVGHKYGLERGTFFEDLTPEEQAARRHRNKGEYIAYLNDQKEREENRIANERVKEENTKLETRNIELRESNSKLEEQLRAMEKKIKSFTTMLNNLKEQKEHLEIDITALEMQCDEGNEEAAKQLAEKQRQLNEINEKIEKRNRQLSDVNEDYDELLTRAVSLETIADNYSKEIALKKSILEKTDKTGEIEGAQRHTANAEEVLYRRWPEARKAVKAIFDMTNHPTNTDFTPQQALDVEHAIVTSGTSRTDAANDLMLLTKKDFDRSGTFSGRIEKTSEVVQSIANNTHRRLTALLKIQPKDAGGSPSYITDLTDWAGNQVKW